MDGCLPMDIWQILHVSLAQHLPAWEDDQDLSSCNWVMSSWRFCSMSTQNDETQSQVLVEMSLQGVGAAGSQVQAGYRQCKPEKVYINAQVNTDMHIWMAEGYTQTWGAIVHLCWSHPVHAQACVFCTYTYINM